MSDRQATDTQIAAARVMRKAARKLGKPVEPWVDELAALPFGAGRRSRPASSSIEEAPDDQAEAGSTR